MDFIRVIFSKKTRITVDRQMKIDLEQMQLEATRVVTELSAYTTIDLIYKETGWETLKARLQRKSILLSKTKRSCTSIFNKPHTKYRRTF